MEVNMPRTGPDWAVSPKGWGARVDYDAWNDRFTPDDGVALHHGGGGNYAAHQPPYSRAKEESQLRAWERYHIDSRKWRGIAYGWAVGQSGTVYRLRGWNRYGAHTGDRDGDGIANNDEIIPILFIGSGGVVDLSGEAQAAIVKLRAWLEAESGRSLTLYGHKELKGSSTSCPGYRVMRYVEENRVLDTAAVPPESGGVILEGEENMFPLGFKDGWSTGPHPEKRAFVAEVQSALGLDYGSQQGLYGNKTAADLQELMGASAPVTSLSLVDFTVLVAQLNGVRGDGVDEEARTRAANAHARLDKLHAV